MPCRAFRMQASDAAFVQLCQMKATCIAVAVEVLVVGLSADHLLLQLLLCLDHLPCQAVHGLQGTHLVGNKPCLLLIWRAFLYTRILATEQLTHQLRDCSTSCLKCMPFDTATRRASG